MLRIRDASALDSHFFIRTHFERAYCTKIDIIPITEKDKDIQASLYGLSSESLYVNVEDVLRIFENTSSSKMGYALRGAYKTQLEKESVVILVFEAVDDYSVPPLEPLDPEHPVAVVVSSSRKLLRFEIKDKALLHRPTYDSMWPLDRFRLLSWGREAKDEYIKRLESRIKNMNLRFGPEGEVLRLLRQRKFRDQLEKRLKRVIPTARRIRDGRSLGKLIALNSDPYNSWNCDSLMKITSGVGI